MLGGGGVGGKVLFPHPLCIITLIKRLQTKTLIVIFCFGRRRHSRGQIYCPVLSKQRTRQSILKSQFGGSDSRQPGSGVPERRKLTS